MIEPTQELLTETLGSTLEEAAFVFAEAQERPPPFRGQALEARIGYQGPQAGELRLVADAGLSATLAANLLGEEEGADTAAQATDAVGELLNMVVGVWVTRLFGDDNLCKLGVPRVREISAAEAGARAPQTAWSTSMVDEEGRRIDLSLSLVAAAP